MWKWLKSQLDIGPPTRDRPDRPPGTDERTPAKVLYAREIANEWGAYGVEFSPNGRFIAVDVGGHLLDAVTGETVHTLPASRWFQFGGDGTSVLAISEEKPDGGAGPNRLTVRRWDTTT